MANTLVRVTHLCNNSWLSLLCKSITIFYALLQIGRDFSYRGAIHIEGA
jgi:hypothetical protein